MGLSPRIGLMCAGVVPGTLFLCPFCPYSLFSHLQKPIIQGMRIGTDKWKHFGVNYAICTLVGDYGVSFALGASLGKEYGDKMSPSNKWDWKDILADLAGIVAGYLTHVGVAWIIT